MKSIKFLVFALVLSSWLGCDVLNEVAKTTGGTTEPTNSEIIGGLKQALEVGTKNAVGFLSKQDGYYGNQLLRIPFPPEVVKVENTLRDIGAGKLVDDFVLKMNRGAEDAAKAATPIFVNAIKTMTISDAKNILFGSDNAATEYFKNKTKQSLYNAFYPKIKGSLDKVNATKLWSDVTSRYNKIPLTKPVNTDITDYATNKALDGLFIKVQEEEKKIRENPAARVTDLLKKVFSQLDK